MPPALYLVRHGHIDAAHIFVGQTDVPLSETGRYQARSLQRELARKPITIVWTSPLARCRETARLILSEHRTACPLITLDAFKEISLGTWEGKEKSWVREHDADAWRRRGENFFSTPPPGGESLSDLANRVLPAFLLLCETARHHEATLLVAHHSVNQAILAYVLALPPEDALRISQPYGALTRIDLSFLLQ